ncbi:MAG: peptidylprolyl isomerase [Methanomassiliicoccales archaeon]|jgi:FKBP-type peptidyl-prolyl cis-trans isomerase 2|nr:peptidylprolyl isomerase [Methanomassiliicoccales archaeon]MDD1755229.1 peptidylprolyl isomerase [Methanomassiliicoccales archaeon]
MSADEVKINKGDIVRLEFSGYLADSNELFDTTNAEVAKDAGIFNENATYAPIPVLVGSGRLFEGLEDALVGAQVGVDQEATIPPEKAAGARDPKLVENIPVRDFLKQDIEPKVGMEVNIKNRMGMITAITPRVVRVDFNRRFAGRTLIYKFKVTMKVEEPVDKVLAVVEMDYGSLENFSAIVDGDAVAITLPDVCKYDQKWILAKYKVVADLREGLKMKTVRFVEEYIKKEEEKKEEKPEEREPEELPQ